MNHPAQKIDDHIVVTDPNHGHSLTFRRIIGAVAYGEPSKIDPNLANPALIIAGELVDERLFLLREFQASEARQTKAFDDLKQAMIQLKDEYLVSIFHVPQDNLAFQDLILVDGLAHYKFDHSKKGVTGKPLYKEKEPEKVWPSFRTHQTMAAVTKLPDALLCEVQAAVLLADRLVREGQLGWEPLMMKRLDRLIKEPLEDRIKSPVYLAYLYVVWLLWGNARANELNRSIRKERELSWVDYHKGQR